MDQSLLVPLLPVALMFLFVVMYFVLYANFIQKLCFGKWHLSTRQQLPPFSGLWPRRNVSAHESPDFDETYIQLKAQLTRVALHEAEALRLAKVLSGNNEQDAKEYISNLRMTMFPLGMNQFMQDQHSRASQLEEAAEVPPPKYDDCVQLATGNNLV